MAGRRLYGAQILAGTNERSLNKVTTRSDLEIFKQYSDHRYNSPAVSRSGRGKNLVGWMASGVKS